MFVQKFTVPVVTDGSGAAVVYSDPFMGRVLALIYTKAGTGGFSNGVTLVASVEETGDSILTLAAGAMNASKTWHPQVPAQSAADGTDITGAYGDVVNPGGRLKFVIAAGGAATAGTFTVVVG